MDSITRAYQTAWEQLIKPPVFDYADHDVGPERIVTRTGDLVTRQSLSVINPQG